MDKKFLGGGFMAGIIFGIIFGNLALGICFGMIFGALGSKLKAGSGPDQPQRPV